MAPRAPTSPRRKRSGRMGRPDRTLSDFDLHVFDVEHAADPKRETPRPAVECRAGAAAIAAGALISRACGQVGLERRCDHLWG